MEQKESNGTKTDLAKEIGRKEMKEKRKKDGNGKDNEERVRTLKASGRRR